MNRRGVYSQRIQLTSDLSVRWRLYSTSLKEKEKKYVYRNYQKQALIRESKSSYSSPVISAYKRSDKKKKTIDFGRFKLIN